MFNLHRNILIQYSSRRYDRCEKNKQKVNQELADRTSQLLEAQTRLQNAPINISEEQKAFLPCHLAIPCLATAERNGLLREVHRFNNLPQPITDKNTFATVGINDSTKKQLITTIYPALQKNDLELARMSSSLETKIQNNVEFSKLKIIDGLQAISRMAVDNAQKLAHRQKQLSLSARGVTGAEGLTSIAEIDLADNNVIQVNMVAAIQELKKFTKIFTPAKPSTPYTGSTHKQQKKTSSYNNSYNSYKKHKPSDSKGGYEGKKFDPDYKKKYEQSAQTKND
jgi:hypothetical protein